MKNWKEKLTSTESSHRQDGEYPSEMVYVEEAVTLSFLRYNPAHHSTECDENRQNGNDMCGGCSYSANILHRWGFCPGWMCILCYGVSFMVFSFFNIFLLFRCENEIDEQIICFKFLLKYLWKKFPFNVPLWIFLFSVLPVFPFSELWKRLWDKSVLYIYSFRFGRGRGKWKEVEQFSWVSQPPKHSWLSWRKVQHIWIYFNKSWSLKGILF